MITTNNKDIKAILSLNNNKEIIRIIDTASGKLVWEKSVVPPTPEYDYLYIQNTYNGQNTITFTTTKTGSPSSTYYSDSVEYSKNGFDFTTLNFVEGTPSTITLEEGEKLYLRNDSGAWNYYVSANTNYHTTITGSQSHIVGGNIKSLVDYTDMTNTMQYSGCFSYLFDGDSTLTSSSNLVMDDDTMVSYAYLYTFQNCTSMTSTVASLPATTLASNCYNHMYYYCSALTTAPSLPATVVTASAYQFMFSYCNSLTSAPAISAIEVGTRGMYSMFSRCTSITSAVLLVTTAGNEAFRGMFYYCSAFNSLTTQITDISATNCLLDWLYRVANTGTLYNNGAAPYVVDSASGIPVGWTNVIPTPSIDYFYVQNNYNGQNTVQFTTTSFGTPQSGTYTTTVEYSKNGISWTNISITDPITLEQGEKVYYRNDNGKWSYNDQYSYYTIKMTTTQNCSIGGNMNTLLDYENPDTVQLPLGCFENFFSNNSNIQSSSITLPSTTLSDRCYSGLFFGTTNLTTAPTLPATSLAKYCYSSMFSNTSITTAPSLPATTLAEGCYHLMFAVTEITTAPTLPATTLVEQCYKDMFANCYFLNSVTTYANDISASLCLDEWLDGVAATGTLHNLGTATYPSGSSGIPSGWTETNS